jgi:hypothetical protein
MKKRRDEIDKWINSSDGQKALNEAHETAEKVVNEFRKSREWTFEEWLRMLFTPYRGGEI